MARIGQGALGRSHKNAHTGNVAIATTANEHGINSTIDNPTIQLKGDRQLLMDLDNI